MEFRLIRDIDDGHKHCVLNRADRLVTNASQTRVQSLGFGQARYGQGMYGGAPEVVVEDDRGSFHHFSYLVRKSLEMWGDLLM